MPAQVLPRPVECRLFTKNPRKDATEITHFPVQFPTWSWRRKPLLSIIRSAFQIEFNFRERKTVLWLRRFYERQGDTGHPRRRNLSMFMVNVVAKLREKFATEHPGYGVLDLKSTV